jgi:LTXXQ motif family protein
MPKLHRWSRAAVVIFVIAGLLTTAQAQRHGGHRMGGGLAATGVCGSGVTIENGLAVIELMIKPAPEQQAALNELKKAAKLNADAITTACGGPYPATLPDRVTASEKRLEAALSAIRNLKPLVNNFYATLSDEQKNTVSGLLILPGL